MKQHTNTIIKLFLLALALSATSLTALARDSLEALRTDLNTEITVRTNADTSIQNQITNITNQSPPSHYIGEHFAGGIIFYVDDSGQHGLIAALADQTPSDSGIQWYNGTFKFTGTTGDGLYAGAMNTAMIIAAQINDNQAGNFAAKLAADYGVREDGVTLCTALTYSAPEICYGDWYLPSKYELNLLYYQRDVVGGFPYNSNYWSSVERDDLRGYTWAHNFSGGSRFTGTKDSMFRVRAIRAF